MRSEPGVRAEGYVSGRFVGALDELVRFWRPEAIGQGGRMKVVEFRNARREMETTGGRIVAARDLSVTGPAPELQVGRFGYVDRRPVAFNPGQRSGSAGPGGAGLRRPQGA